MQWLPCVEGNGDNPRACGRRIWIGDRTQNMECSRKKMRQMLARVLINGAEVFAAGFFR